MFNEKNRGLHTYRGILLVACLALCTAVLANMSADSGTVKTVKGDVRIERDGGSLAVKVGDQVRVGDRIVVPKDGSAGITLRDDTIIAAGPGSRIVIDQFVFNPTTREGKVETTLLRGMMKYFSGVIAKRDPASVRVRTPNATVGIRGTEFIVEVPDDK